MFCCQLRKPCSVSELRRANTGATIVLVVGWSDPSLIGAPDEALLWGGYASLGLAALNLHTDR